VLLGKRRSVLDYRSIHELGPKGVQPSHEKPRQWRGLFFDGPVEPKKRHELFGASRPFVCAVTPQTFVKGYIEGRSLAVERYSVEGHVENSSAVARNVVSRNPDLIFTVGDWMVKALRETTSTVPIVAVTRDPVAESLTQSLARPTGNITGVMVAVSVEIYAKRIQLLREIVPTLSRVGILMGPEPGDFETQTRQIVQMARVAVVEPTRVESNSDAEYRRVLSAISQAGAEALLVNDHVHHVTNRQVIIELASTFGLPAIYPQRAFVAAGGLMAYGIDVPEIFRQCARQIDKVLKGSNPGEIPFYQPTKFELLINLKAAKEIGLTVPPSMLSLADELIE
jgi:putative ABC transport system substrate-binding protein